MLERIGGIATAHYTTRAALVLVLSTISFALWVPQTSVTIRSAGHLGQYVYVQDGRFHKPDGTPIYFAGMNMRTGWTYASGPFLLEKDIQRMAEIGVNAIRLCISPRHVEPTLDNWNEGYLSKLDDILSWCEKYGIYVTVSYQIGEGSHAIPTWMRSSLWGQDIWNATMEEEVVEFWDMISRRWSGKPIIVGYELPWNEPNFLLTYSSGDGGVWATEPYLTDWREWLRAKYTTLEALNETWSCGDPGWDQYNVLEASEGETQFSGIRLPYTIRENKGLYWQSDLRMLDFSEFVYETWYNKAQRVAQVILANDGEHVLIFNAIHAVYHRILMNRHMIIPPQFQALAFHNYVTNLIEPYPPFTVEERLRVGTLAAKQMYIFNRTLAVLDTETVDNTPAWGKSYLIADYGNGLAGSFFWCWERVVDVRDPERGFYSDWLLLKDLFKIIRSGPTEWMPRIALISNDYYCSSRIRFLAMLREYNLQADLVPDGAIAKNPLFLNRYKIVIAEGKRMLNATINALIDWVEGANDRYLLLLGMIGDTPYHKDINAQHWGLWEGHIVKTNPSAAPRSDAAKDGEDVVLSVSVAFGGINQEQALAYRKSEQQARHHHDHTTMLDYNALVGHETMLWDDTNDRPAMWRINRTCYFFDFPSDYSQAGFRSVIVSWLRWTGQADLTENRISALAFKGTDHIVLWESNNATTHGYIKISELPDGMYVLYNHTSQATLVKSSTELIDGIYTYLHPYEYQIFTVKSAEAPTLIDWTTNGKLEEFYDSDQQRLTIEVEAPVNFTTTLKLFTAQKGEPIEIQGAESWTYDEGHKIVTAQILHTDFLKTIHVVWLA